MRQLCFSFAISCSTAQSKHFGLITSSSPNKERSLKSNCIYNICQINRPRHVWWSISVLPLSLSVLIKLKAAPVEGAPPFPSLIESWDDKQASQCSKYRAWEKAKESKKANERRQVCRFASAYLTNDGEIKVSAAFWQLEWRECGGGGGGEKRDVSCKPRHWRALLKCLLCLYTLS